MNRTEFQKVLDLVIEDVTNPNANFVARFGETPFTREEQEAIAGIALMAVDRYYQYLSTRMAERKEP